MNYDLSRRAFLGAMGAAIVGCSSRTKLSTDATGALLDVEKRIGGRLGVYAIATDNGAVVSHRGTELFAMCSTFKWVLVAAVLLKVDKGELSLSQNVAYGAKDLLEYAPITRKNVAREHMTVQELAEAAVTVSDNTAANLLLERVGGPVGLTRFLRDHGDTVTRLDRSEPMLNTNDAGDPRDSTSPQAMVSTMRTLLTTAALAPSSRELLFSWMVASRTGSERLRAGLPATWRAGDKTGTCEHGAVNDVAIAWPPNRAPIFIAAYMSGSRSPQSALLAAHRDVGSIVALHLSGNRAPQG
jgi:beta-lactamase class A